MHGWCAWTCNELFNVFETMVFLYTEHMGDMLCAEGFALVSASFEHKSTPFYKSPMSVIPLFQWSVKYSSRNFSVHLVVRFVVRCHFDTHCTCSNLCALHSVPPCPCCTLDRLNLLIHLLSELEILDINVEQVSKPTPTILWAMLKKLRCSLHC